MINQIIQLYGIKYEDRFEIKIASSDVSLGTFYIKADEYKKFVLYRMKHRNNTFESVGDTETGLYLLDIIRGTTYMQRVW